MTELINADTQYKGFLTKIQDCARSIERSRLLSVWDLGSMVHAFFEAQDRAIYGSRTIHTLVDDLRKSGCDLGVKDTVRFLYWAKSIAVNYDRDQLTELVSHGFTFTHAKMLLAVDDAVRIEVSKQLFDENGRIIPTDATEALIKSVWRRNIMDKAAESAKEAELAAVRSDEEVSEPGDIQMTQASTDDGPINGFELNKAKGKEPAPAAEPAKPKESKEAKPEKAKATKDDAPALKGSPLKIIGKYDTLLMKATAEAADVFIAIRETSKRGYDSDTAQKKFLDTVRDLRGAANNLRSILDEIVKVADDECGA